MISFRAPAIIHIPHSGKNKQQPWLHLISVSLQITHPWDCRQLGKRGTPLHVLDLSRLPHQSCFVCVWNLTPQEVEILRRCPCCAAVLLESTAAKAMYLEDSVWFHSSLVAKESRLWLLIGWSWVAESQIMGRTVELLPLKLNTDILGFWTELQKANSVNSDL